MHCGSVAGLGLRFVRIL